MPKLVILGSAGAVPAPGHENTHMILFGEKQSLLVDCGSNPFVKLRNLGLDLDTPTDMVLTHFHPDHVAGLPNFFLSSWLAGRKQSLNLYGLRHTLDRTKALMDLFEWHTFPDMFPIRYIEIPSNELTPVIEGPEIRVFASPVRHVIPNIGLRIEIPVSDKVLTYSSDTEPCQEVVRLAHSADVLIHEASGVHTGHSSAAQAGEVARQADARELFLIHYPVGGETLYQLVEQAKTTFDGSVKLAEDLIIIDF